MPKVVKKQETVQFEGLSISNFLNEKFLKNLENQKLDVTPTGLIFMSKEGEPIILVHESKELVMNKKMNIITPSSGIIEKFIKLLEGME